MELFYGMKIVLQWELPIFLCLVIVYAALFRYRNTSTSCRVALHVILVIWALLLILPTLFAIMVAPFLIVSAVFVQMESSQRMENIAGGLIIGGIIIAAWRGILYAVQHLERSPQPSVKVPS